jgi:hypothetical protein
VSALVIPQIFEDGQQISALSLQANFEVARDAINSLDADNFDAATIPAECLIARMAPAMVTFAPTHGQNISWAALHRLCPVTGADWELQKIGVYCQATTDGTTVQLATAPATTHYTADVKIGPLVEPVANTIVYADLYGVVLNKGQMLWFEQTVNGTYGSADDDTEGAITGLRILLYFNVSLGAE